MAVTHHCSEMQPFSPHESEVATRGVMPAKKRSHRHGDRALLAIAIFKFIKGALFLALVFGALSFLHKDVASEVERWLDQLRVDPDNQFIGKLLGKLQLIHAKELKELSALGVAYAALFLTEGTGLLFRKRWAEWLTIIATSSLMPFEVYELIKKFTVVRLVVLVINAAVVLYLIYLVRQKDPGSEK
jgi:uncharacterized membrane protein (DUF2068 family)